VTEAARNAVAAEGYDPVFGARPLKRVLQQRVQNQLATELLKGTITEGHTVTIDYLDDEFVFRQTDPHSTTVETESVVSR
jgi:ATP-dependent Clp protease ATP-binding subunit ClpB